MYAFILNAIQKLVASTSVFLSMIFSPSPRLTYPTPCLMSPTAHDPEKLVCSPHQDEDAPVAQGRGLQIVTGSPFSMVLTVYTPKVLSVHFTSSSHSHPGKFNCTIHKCSPDIILSTMRRSWVIFPDQGWGVRLDLIMLSTHLSNLSLHTFLGLTCS